MEPVCLSAKNSVFLLIDVQEKLLPAISNEEQVLFESERLLRAASVLKIPVLATEQYPKGLGGTVDPLSSILDHSLLLTKTTFSCFGAEGFEELLEKQDRKTVVLFGIESHICLFATAMELKRRGYETVVAVEACGSRKLEHHELAMRNLLAADVAILPVETIIYQLLYRSGTPEFKALLPLFK